MLAPRRRLSVSAVDPGVCSSPGVTSPADCRGRRVPGPCDGPRTAPIAYENVGRLSPAATSATGAVARSAVVIRRGSRRTRRVRAAGRRATWLSAGREIAQRCSSPGRYRLTVPAAMSASLHRTGFMRPEAKSSAWFACQGDAGSGLCP
jgi:hypothetical protein